MLIGPNYCKFYAVQGKSVFFKSKRINHDSTKLLDGKPIRGIQGLGSDDWNRFDLDFPRVSVVILESTKQFSTNSKT
jgi:hypothetical protein